MRTSIFICHDLSKQFSIKHALTFYCRNPMRIPTTLFTIFWCPPFYFYKLNSCKPEKRELGITKTHDQYLKQKHTTRGFLRDHKNEPWNAKIFRDISHYTIDSEKWKYICKLKRRHSVISPSNISHPSSLQGVGGTLKKYL